MSYAGRVEHRPVLNGGGRGVVVGDIERAVRLSRRVSWLALGATVAGRVLVGRALAGRRTGGLGAAGLGLCKRLLKKGVGV